MPRLTKEQFAIWRSNVIKAIEKLNITLGNDLTGEGFYDLEYRGKNHRLVLTHDSFVIARGMKEIEETLHKTFVYYHYLKEQDLWK